MSLQDIIQIYRDEIIRNNTMRSLSAKEIITQNFEDTCISHNMFPLNISYGDCKQELIDGIIKQTMEKACIELIMPINLVDDFIEKINYNGIVMAEKIKYIRNEIYDTISSSLIPSCTISVARSAETLEAISIKPFESEEKCYFLIRESTYNLELENIGLTQYDTVGRVFIIDPRTNKNADAYPGLFTEIYRVMKSITNTHSE